MPLITISFLPNRLKPLVTHTWLYLVYQRKTANSMHLKSPVWLWKFSTVSRNLKSDINLNMNCRLGSVFIRVSLYPEVWFLLRNQPANGHSLSKITGIFKSALVAVVLFDWKHDWSWLIWEWLLMGNNVGYVKTQHCKYFVARVARCFYLQ